MKNLSDLSDFKALRISLASPQEILSWSHGEITKPETINYRTFRPEKDGLFDERIFGPTKDYECYCGKYKRIRYKGVICDKCGVEVTHSRVRRERLGHLILASPVAHVWYFRGIPSQLGTLLEISPRDLESVVYFSAYLVVEIDSGKKAETISALAKEKEASRKEIEKEMTEKTDEIEARYHAEREKLKKQGKEAQWEGLQLSEKKELALYREEILKRQIEKEEEFKALEAYLKGLHFLSVVTEAGFFEVADYLNRFALVKMGAEALLYVLERYDLLELARTLKKQMTKASGQKLVRIAKRLRVCESFRSSGVSPAWTILRHLVVIPPELRPMVQLEGGRFATSDLNDLYRRVINRNNRLKKLLDLGAPEIIIRNEKRMLQEAVDSLIDSSKQRATARPMRGRQELRSLSDLLKGKQGRFRRNLLGKRVDYSGRSVIVVGPHLRLDQCGLPKEMVLELFKPFVLGQILKRGLAPNLKSARFFLDGRSSEVWDILEGLVKDYPVLLNRAPTLHRLGIQAFYPILIDGSAIQLHPCVCKGYNADFDGDQMAVHVPLSQNSLREVKELMLSTHNLLSPASGNLLTVPDREMLVGCYYLTSFEETRSRPSKTGADTVFASEDEAWLAHDFGRIRLRQKIQCRLGSGLTVETSVGRIIFNQALPPRLRFFNQETNKENNALRRLIEEALGSGEAAEAVTLIDSLKSIGFHYATLSGISLGLSDCVVPAEKPQILVQAEADVVEVDHNFRRGLVTKREKLRLVEGIWTEVTNRLDDLSRKSLPADNPLRVMVVSGARGTWDQVKQICGARGLIVDPVGRLVELPIKSNYREGLSGFEYFASARGARKGLVDTALKTADAGYLTRRLVDVAQDVVVREDDCGASEGLEVVRGEEHYLTTFALRIYGRVLAAAVPDPENPRKALIKERTLIGEEELRLIEEKAVTKIKVRSLIFCEANYGVCSACYGLDLSTKELVKVGVPVGIIAAQSIGEPGTQLTLRTKHVSGIATSKDVTQGLPRVEEVFEARTPKFLANLSETIGRVSLTEKENKRVITVKAPVESGFDDRTYEVDRTLNLTVAEGDLVGIGSQLCEGYLDLVESLRTRGSLETARYIVSEIQKVYSSQGVSLNDKHVETIVRQMFSRVRIESGGSTRFLPGEVVSKSLFKEENQRILEKGGEPATAEAILLGITRAALATESFLASASFIETTKELTEASISGKIDRLLGLKENVIIGRLIPVGERARIK